MIELQRVSFQYEDTGHGVLNIDLTIMQGECVVLCGRSGNGKTTLTRIVNGLAPQYYPGSLGGQVRIGGEEATCTPLWQRGKAVGSVFQDPGSQFFSSELVGEVAFACENYGMEHETIVARTDEAIAAFGLEKLRRRSIDLLSSGEKQRVAIASVYALGPKIYVFDEPTANLDKEGAAQLAETLAQLKAEGYTLLIAEHRLAWLRGIADRIVYIENGRIVWQRTPQQVAAMDKSDLTAYGLRSLLPAARPPLPVPSGEGAPCIQAEGLAVRRRGVSIWEGLEFAAWSHQVVAITGGNGAGKTTLARVLAGLSRQSAGKVKLGGMPLPSSARRKRAWYSDNDTGAQFFTSSVSDELLLCSNRSEETLDKARALLKELGLYDYKDAHPATLSGGQKQRLSIACGLLSGREVLIFDEPTSGLDGSNLRLVSGMFRKAAEEGKCVLVITHDNELIDECCSHLYVLANAYTN